MAVAYLDRRDNLGPWGGTRAHLAYREWVDAFPKFMVIAYPDAMFRLAAREKRTARR